MKTIFLQIRRKTKMNWEDDVMKDTRTINIKSWRIGINRSKWIEIVE
jgi:hypothetical protein